MGSAVVASGLRCPVAREILDQGSNLCSLHWKLDSYPVDYQGNLTTGFKNLHFATLVGAYLITEEDPLFNFYFLPPWLFAFLLLRKEISLV